MSNLSRKRILLCVLAFCIALYGQTGADDQAATTTADLIRGIAEGETQSILESGNRGDRVFIPYLRKHIDKRKSEREGITRYARLALAKLGEADQLQAQLCSLRADPNFRDVRYIGGWFGISEAVRMLEQNWQYGSASNYMRVPYDPRNADQVVPSPREVAILALPKIVPNSPLPDNQTGTANVEGNAHLWRNWIASHEQELRQLKPTGEGVDFSENACKKRPKKAARKPLEVDSMSDRTKLKQEHDKR